jgi:hypothetical protein
MLDREIGFAGPEPEKAAQIPAAGEARVELERAVDQPDHRTDVSPNTRAASARMRGSFSATSSAAAQGRCPCGDLSPVFGPAVRAARGRSPAQASAGP